MARRPPGALVDRMLQPVHRWVWGDVDRRVRKLFAFGEVETDGGRDILRAAEITPDPLLRRLYLEHAIDELRHGVLFRERGAALLRTVRPSSRRGSRRPASRRPWPRRSARRTRTRSSSPRVPARRGEGGGGTVHPLSGDRRRRSGDSGDLRGHPARRSVSYELHATRSWRAWSPELYRRQVWRARASRLWKRYLRVAASLAGVLGGAMLPVIHFVLLPPFAWPAKRARGASRAGWITIAHHHESPTSQY